MAEARCCEFCEAPLQPTPEQWARGVRTATKRFCNHYCAAQWRSAGHRVEVTCPTCRKSFAAQAHRVRGQTQVFCSKACYDTAHAAQSIVCATCKKTFLSKSYRKNQKYCSNACFPRAGKLNPNYGRRHPGMFEHSAAFRLWLSKARRRAGNPAWKGGSRTTGAWAHQTFSSKWAEQHLPQGCEVCGKPHQHLHHVVPGRMFSPRLLMQFRQNLVHLCDLHQRRTVEQARAAIASGQWRRLPFADRLPPAILRALKRGGSVSSPVRGCDYSPLGNIGESIQSGRWRSDKAA